MPTDSVSSRRAAKASACAEARSSDCALSMTQSKGCFAAASDSRPSAASATRKRSGEGPLIKPKAVLSASRWGLGRRSSRSSMGAQTWSSAAKASSISESKPTARAKRRSDADSTAYSRRAVLPTPGSPRTTSARLLPLRTALSSSSSVSHSRARPSSFLDTDLGVGVTSVARRYCVSRSVPTGGDGHVDWGRDQGPRPGTPQMRSSTGGGTVVFPPRGPRR